VSIRPAQPEDAAAIALLHIRTWQAAYRGQLPDPFLTALDADIDRRTAWWERSIANAESRSQRQLVALDGDRVVGFVTFGPSEDEPREPRIGQVYAIYVDSGYWDRGYGRDLFTSAVRGLTDAGFSAATCWVLETNSRARRFYEAAGWITDGAHKTEQRGEVELREVRYRSAPLVGEVAR
jgi:ribosomal protein S18 acetylase RimI-like enzyme